MKLFEICSADKDVRFSPFVWRVIMCLHHKGLSFDRVAMSFLEAKEQLKTEPQTVPVLEDGDKQVVDSFEIAKYLDEAYPENPLFDTDKPIEKYQDLNVWTDRTIALGVFRMLVKDIHDLQDPEN
ncbi:MAG: glutathione S-transferase N-terminal domain-containing protein, partial [Kordiimonas sp.]